MLDAIMKGYRQGSLRALTLAPADSTAGVSNPYMEGTKHTPWTTSKHKRGWQNWSFQVRGTVGINNKRQKDASKFTAIGKKEALYIFKQKI